jgi:phage-related protein
VLGLVGMSTSSILRIISLIVKGIIVGFGIITFLSLQFSGAVCNVSAMVQKRFVQYL